MNLVGLIALAVALSMDSFAVSLSSGVVLSPFKLRSVLKIALYLAFFQAAMPIVGWWLGVGFIDYIKTLDHWIAFALLMFLGIKMVYEACTPDEECACGFNPTKSRNLIQMGIATSIDALAVGVSFAFLDISLYQASVIIFAATFLISATGCYVGKFIGMRWKRTSSVIGGVILIGLGVKILIEHLFFQ